MTDRVTKQASRHLGRNTEYKTTYAPEVLNPIDRTINRIAYNIDSENLPFCGYDVWNVYEIGFLTETGLPVVGVGKIVYPANTPYMIESKSMKLYFFSFNMMRYGKTPEEAVSIVEEIIAKDLSNAVGGPVEFQIRTKQPERRWGYYLDWPLIEEEFSTPLTHCTFDTFKEDPSLLKVYHTPTTGQMQFRTSLLRSNCRVTHQPDWGDLFVRYTGEKTLDLLSFMEYIVSFRGENHFHEEVVEMIFKRLLDALEPKDLLVTALYTRRGGVDICPTRSINENEFQHDALTDVNLYVEKTLRQ